MSMHVNECMRAGEVPQLFQRDKCGVQKTEKSLGDQFFDEKLSATIKTSCKNIWLGVYQR